MDSHIHEEINETGSFTIDLWITRKSKDKLDLESLLEEALIRDYPHEWILSRQEKFRSEGLQKTAECIISTATIQFWKNRNEPLCYTLEMEEDEWMKSAAAKGHEAEMDNYYRIQAKIAKESNK